MSKILFGFLLFLVTACASSEPVVDKGRSMTLSNNGTTTCQLIEKAFVIKNGVESDVMELYLRCSIQDYFIKLCESDVSAKELRKYLDKGITVEMEIKEGLWDKCEGDPEVQSRMGAYVTISKIEK